MDKIGEYRLKICELFYHRPICEYAETDGRKKTENVLILGSGWIGVEAFKAVFWAGQCLDSELNITVASQNASAFQKQVLSGEPSAVLPALRLYTEEKHYANLFFQDIDVASGIDQAGLAPLDFENRKYNYIIVSLGDGEHNWIAALELLTRLYETQRNGLEYSGKRILCIFQEASETVDEEDRTSLVTMGEEYGIEVHFFGKESPSVSADLERTAKNLNFAYEMQYDQRIGKKQADEHFDESKRSEFLESPHAYQEGDLKIVSNFIGAEYNADSSLASAVHIPVKLAACREFAPDVDPVDSLKQAIREKNRLYGRLCMLEHRRWNAYMIMRGYRAPSVQEEQTLLYQGGNTHQDKKKLLHICLCDCGEKAVLGKEFDRQYHQWIRKKCPQDFFSELDRASLRCHQLTELLARKTDVKQLVNRISGDCLAYANLRRSIFKLANDEENSLAVYRNALDAALAYARSVSEEESAAIREVDRALAPIKTRNARTDFFGLDAQLVEMIPFSLWYESKYDTVLTISDGMASAAQDVIVPTLFCAPNAVFVGKAVGSRKYQQTIGEYFENRGATTVPRFDVLPSADVDILFDAVDGKVQELGVGRLLVNCISGGNSQALLAVGKLMEKYGDGLHVVQYHPNKGIQSFSEDQNIGAGLENKSFSLSEFLRLKGGRFDNEYAVLYSSDQYDALAEFFREFCEPRNVRMADGKDTVFHVWSSMADFFSRSARDEKLEPAFTQTPEEPPMEYRGRFSQEVYTECGIGRTLKLLQDYRVIWEYREQKEGRLLEISFVYRDTTLETLLRTFEAGQIRPEHLYQTLKFLPVNDGLKLSDRQVREQQLFLPTDPEEMILAKSAFLRRMEEKKFLSGLEIDADGRASFVFKDNLTMNLFRKQGSIFELVVYNLLRESGMFDDIETGVKIAWDAEKNPADQVLLRLLNEPGSEAFGYRDYVSMRKKVLARRTERTVENEIDVIAVKDMNPVFLSCKTGANPEMGWLYEINSIAEHFQAAGVMVASSNFDQKARSMLRERAAQMKVPLWGTETLWDPDRLREALRHLIHGTIPGKQ